MKACGASRHIFALHLRARREACYCLRESESHLRAARDAGILRSLFTPYLIVDQFILPPRLRPAFCGTHMGEVDVATLPRTVAGTPWHPRPQL